MGVRNASTGADTSTIIATEVVEGVKHRARRQMANNFTSENALKLTLHICDKFLVLLNDGPSTRFSFMSKDILYVVDKYLRGKLC